VNLISHIGATDWAAGDATSGTVRKPGPGIWPSKCAASRLQFAGTNGTKPIHATFLYGCVFVGGNAFPCLCPLVLVFVKRIDRTLPLANAAAHWLL